MAPAAPILLGISTAMSVVGALKQGSAGEAASRIQQQQAQKNADLSIQQSAEDERVFRIGLRKQLGEARAAQGASGLQLGGTANEMIAESAAMGEMDALKIRHAGELRALGYKTDAQLSGMRADSYGSGKYLSAAGYLLGGAGSMMGKLDPGGVSSSSYDPFKSYAPGSSLPGPYAPRG